MRSFVLLAALAVASLSALACGKLGNELKGDPEAAPSAAASGVSVSATALTVTGGPVGTVALTNGAAGATVVTTPGATAAVSGAKPHGTPATTVVNAQGTKVGTTPGGATNVQAGGVTVKTNGKGGSTVVVPGVGTVVTP